MAAAYHVDGPTEVLVDTASANALESLGHSADGIDIDEQGYWLDVPTDLNGGTDGVPGDIQHFGQTHTIRMEMTKFDVDVWEKIVTMQNELGASAAGTSAPAGVGQLTFGGGFVYRVLLKPSFDGGTTVNRPRNYLRCLPRNKSTNKSSKYRRAFIEWTAYPDDSGIIYNLSTS